MNHDLYREVLPKLERDFGLKAKSGDWMSGGKCPVCNQKELYTNKEHPWVLKCGRLEKCGAEIHIKDQYPELFENWGDRYEKTPEAPNAAADAYLRSARGFNLELIPGTYIQESYYDHEKKIGSATVRFALPNGVYWERIIDQPQRFGGKKAHFNKGAKYAGMAWTPPAAMPHDEIWIVEGIFNSIALLHHDIWAASAMSCSNYPHLFLQGVIEACEAAERPRPKLVWALDDGKAGTTYAKKFNDRAEKHGWKTSCALIRSKGKFKPDWNDQHLADRLKPEHIEDYRYQGKLLTAKNAGDKASLIYARKSWGEFYFDFDSRMYWFEINFAKYSEAKADIEERSQGTGKTPEEIRDLALKASGSVKEISNCNPVALYYQANHLTDEAWYYIRVDFPHDGPAVKNTFTGGQLSSSSEFKKRMLAIAPGALFTGSALHLDLWLKKQMFGIKTVQTIDFIGYSKEYAAWIFDDIAVKDGRAYNLNDEDFFDIGKLAVKSLNQSVSLAINPEPKDYDDDWAKLLWFCFRQKGIVALAYWLGALFAEQIRAMQESYPFIEIVGDPGSGKSTIIEFMWKLVGRSNYEGFDPQKATIAARARNMAQVANLPIVLIESDRDSGDGSDKLKQKGFDWDELKTAYNGRSVRSTGVKNGGNDTREPPFRGALVISQNATVAASDAFMQRLMHVHFELQPHTEASREAFQLLARYPVAKVSGFALLATKAEAAILATVAERTPLHEKTLDANPAIKHFRIVKNHAQLMALVDALSHVITMRPETTAAVHAEITRMAEERQQAINADHPKVQEFWEIFDYIEGRDDVPVLNHSRNDDEIAINLNDFIAKATDRRQQIPDMNEIKRQLRTSRTRKFLEANKTINSALRGSSIKCWVFQREKSSRKASDE